MYGKQRIQLVLLRLKRAGVEYSISPQQFIAAKVISAVLFTFLALFFLSTLGHGLSLIAVFSTFGGFLYPELWLRETSDVRRGSILRTLPFYLDIITLSVEAGSNLTGGLTQAVQKSADSPLRREFSRVLRDIRAGKTRAESLREMAERTGSQPVSNVVTGLIQAEKTGSSLGPLLRAQAEQLRSERFQRAEKKAMEAPVKLLGPLVMFIFPTTFIVLTFLVTSKALQEGVISWAPLIWAYTWPRQ
jgi:tight adherence protein C